VGRAAVRKTLAAATAARPLQRTEAALIRPFAHPGAIGRSGNRALSARFRGNVSAETPRLRPAPAGHLDGEQGRGGPLQGPGLPRRAPLSGGL